MANFRPAPMKREQAEGIDELLSRFVTQNGLWDGLFRQAVFDAWDTCSGAARYTINKYLRDNILYITISSSALRYGLSRSLPQIRELINQELAKNSFLSSHSDRAFISDIRLR